MKPLLALALFALLLLGIPSVALALRFESFGNEPALGGPGWPAGLREVANLPTRVYFYGGDGPNICYFRGNARELQEALDRFARVEEGKCRLILLPGPVHTRAFSGQRIDFNWRLDLGVGEGRRSRKEPPVLRVYVNLPGPRPLTVDARTVERWLAGLESEDFPTRDRARQRLAGLGNDAKPLYRATLAGTITLEKRRRLEGLLHALPAGIDVTDFEVPAALKFLTPDDLVAEHLEKLPRGLFEEGALEELARLEPCSDKVVPALTSLLAGAKSDWLRHGAARALGEIGCPARPALPALRASRAGADPNLRKELDAVIGRLEQCEEGAGDPARLRKRAIGEDLRELKKRRESAKN